jgi:hypothetical protein
MAGAEIGNHHPDTAGQGDYRHPVAFGQRLGGKDFGEIFQFGEIIGHDHPGLFDRRFDDLGVAGDTAGMAHRRPGAGLGASAAEEDHRFFGGNLLGDPGQVAAVADRFQVHRDDLDLLFIAEVFQQIIFVDVALVANRTDLADVQAFIGDDIRRHPRREQTGLADQHHVAPGNLFGHRVD